MAILDTPLFKHVKQTHASVFTVESFILIEKSNDCVKTILTGLLQVHGNMAASLCASRRHENQRRLIDKQSAVNLKIICLSRRIFYGFINQTDSNEQALSQDFGVGETNTVPNQPGALRDN
jgi:hypothetical protein